MKNPFLRPWTPQPSLFDPPPQFLPTWETLPIECRQQIQALLVRMLRRHQERRLSEPNGGRGVGDD